MNYPEQTDTQLIKLACQDDRDCEAFNELVDRHHKYMWSVCMKFADSEDEGKDHYQKALIKSWKSLPTFRGDCHFKTWFYQIIRGIVYDHSRWKSRKGEISLEGVFFSAGGNDHRPSSDTTVQKNFRSHVIFYRALKSDQNRKPPEQMSNVYEASLNSQPTPLDSLLKQEGNVELKNSLEKRLKPLSKNHKECLSYIAEGLSYEEIAKKQNIPLGTVMSRVFHARKTAQMLCQGLEK